jgi:hypothetical protein
MMIVVTVLIYAVSLKFQLSPCVTIHNQCSNIKLVSPIYFGNGAVCPKLSNQQIDIGTERKACFKINATQNNFEGALLFKLQKENRFSIYSSSLFNLQRYFNSKAKCVQMLIAWKVKESKLLSYVVLIEHDKTFIWNENVLKKLYDNSRDWLKEYNDTILETWLMDDDIVLETTLGVKGLKGSFELIISISKGEKNDFDIRPLYVDLER